MLLLPSTGRGQKIQVEHVMHFHTDACFIGNCQLWVSLESVSVVSFPQTPPTDVGCTEKENMASRSPPLFAVRAVVVQ